MNGPPTPGKHSGRLDPVATRRILEERARAAGFDLVGVGRADPRKLQKSARSVVSLGVSYYPGDHPENTEGGGRVARYAWGRDYHEVIRERLFRLRGELEEKLGVKIKARGFTDAVPLLERSAAQHAGLGFFGRNSCLINGEIGSYFF